MLRQIIRYFSHVFNFGSKRKGRLNSIVPLIASVRKFAVILTFFLSVILLVVMRLSDWSALLTLWSVIGAYFFAGSAIGFVFAVPKSFQHTVAPVDDSARKHRDSLTYEVKDNTSLEEISDWITKIIIGLSLTQFGEIESMVHRAAVEISNAFESHTKCSDVECEHNYLPFAYSLIILYSLIGLVLGYLWTRIEFPKVLMQRQNEMNELRRLRDAVQASLNDPAHPMNISTEDVQAINSEDKSKNELITQIVSMKPPGSDSEDPQKGRWGGRDIVDNRRLRAEVTASLIPGFYKVRIIVATLDRSNLHTAVGFILHDSFNPILRIVDAGDVSEVSIEVTAYEAFTVAAICDVNSETDYKQLELDLDKIPNAPRGFRWSR